MTEQDQDSSAWEALPPVRFNAWKHHAGFLRRQAAPPADLAWLAECLKAVGHDLMDLYDGPRTPADIAAALLAELAAHGRLGPDEFRDWLREAGGFRVLILADASAWVLRWGAEPGRYVHVHPARGAPNTSRVRAGVLKTAVLARAWAIRAGADPCDLAVINRVRQEYLGLPPVPRLAETGGLREVIGRLG